MPSPPQMKMAKAILRTAIVKANNELVEAFRRAKQELSTIVEGKET